MDTHGLDRLTDPRTLDAALKLLAEQGMPPKGDNLARAIDAVQQSAGSGLPSMQNSGSDPLDALMSRTDRITPAPNPPKVESVLLDPTMPKPGPRSMDQIARANLQSEMSQGPGKLNSTDAMAADGTNGANTTSDTSNTPPGTQDYKQSTVSGTDVPVLEDPELSKPGMKFKDAAMGGGALTALLATLSKRHKPSLGQSIHLGNVQAPQAASQYEGVITQATPQEMAKLKSRNIGVRSKTAKRRKKSDDE